MTKEEFIKLTANCLKPMGFIRKGRNFYFDFNNGILGVLGMQKSMYGPYYYIEYGFAFSEFNPRMPYPNFSELNLNCGRIMFEFEKGRQTTVLYEELTSNDEKTYAKTLEDRIAPFLIAGKLGRAGIVDAYIPNCDYITGENTLRYLNISGDGLDVYSELK